MTRERSAASNRDLREVGSHSKDDDSAKRRANVEAGRENVGGVGQLHSGKPDNPRARTEYGEQNGKLEAGKNSQANPAGGSFCERLSGTTDYLLDGIAGCAFIVFPDKIAGRPKCRGNPRRLLSSREPECVCNRVETSLAAFGAKTKEADV